MQERREFGDSLAGRTLELLGGCPGGPVVTTRVSF